MAQFLSKADIQKRVEQMAKDSVEAFFMGRSPAKGGPFGAGATIVEINPDFPEKKKSRKYILSFSDVDGEQPMGKKTPWFSTDKVKDVVNNIFDRQEPYRAP